MANRKATFAKRQRETDLKDRARAKDARRSQKRNEVSDTKGPQIAWDEAVRPVTSDDLPSLSMANQGSSDQAEDAAAPGARPADGDPAEAGAAPPVTSPGPAVPPRGG